MNSTSSLIALIPLFPLVGFTINGFWYALVQAPRGKNAGAMVPGVIGTLAIFGSFIVSLMLFLQLQGMPEESRVLEQTLFSWMKVDGFSIDMAFRLDSLNTLFTLVVSGVGALIHLYSIGYMAHDDAPGKFFSYLNLFCFAMLILVLGSSLPILFLGWEGVGLCSYLLVGYWYQDTEKAAAGKKAFIVNRVGDFGFLLGMFMIFAVFGTLDFEALKQIIMAGGGALPAGISVATVTTICLLLFVGCMGKSAQIPLFVWLPDAMAGPTPVSALIHAATMVTSGIYMISRLNFLYSFSSTALTVIASVGAFTAIFAATIAIVQKDIKKILAYSTVSQLGYMFLACGVGAYSAGVFHVITHAFFKALMFLGAGSVIHGMHEEQDIMKMGGLKRWMPITAITFAMGWLAISGVPLFSGFFSKDEILWLSFASVHGATWLWVIGVVTAVLTAFYMTRLYSLTFLGKPRFDEHHTHVHESPAVMWIPLAVLGVLSVVGGFIGLPFAHGKYNWLAHWLAPVIPETHHLAPGMTTSMEYSLMAVSVAGALFGIWFAFSSYKDLAKAEARSKRFAGLHKVLDNKWYVDEIYDALIVRPIHAISEGLWKGFDVAVIDRIVVGFGKISERVGQTARTLQTGSIQVYALMLLIGMLATVGYLVYGMAR